MTVPATLPTLSTSTSLGPRIKFVRRKLGGKFRARVPNPRSSFLTLNFSSLIVDKI